MNNMLAITYLHLIYDFIDSAVLSGNTSFLYTICYFAATVPKDYCFPQY